MGYAPKRPIESAAASRVTKTILDVDRVCTHYHILCRHRLGVGVPAGIFVAVVEVITLADPRLHARRRRRGVACVSAAGQIQGREKLEPHFTDTRFHSGFTSCCHAWPRFSAHFFLS
jgi:hypothetical protein